MGLRLDFWHRPTWASRITRIVAVTTAFFGVGTWLIERGHAGYWKTTIFQVQTVDFNILSHTLPTTLSLAVMREDWVAIQKILDSNYSLFGLVVTDPEGKKILAMSNSKVVLDSFGWQRKLAEQPSTLQEHPYNYLVDPPPISAQTSYTDPYVKDPQQLQKPAGKVIGRIYYIRGIPPSLLEDLQMWVANPLAKRDSFPLYFNTSLLVGILLVLTCLLMETLINLKQREYEQLLKENEEVSKQLSSEQQLLNSLKENLAFLENSKAEYTQELDAIKAQKELLERQLQDISQDNQALIERYSQIQLKESALTSRIEQLEKQIAEQENSTRSIAETQKHIQIIENRVIQQTRDILRGSSLSADKQDMAFELLRKIVELGFIPNFGKDISQILDPRNSFNGMNHSFDSITKRLSEDFNKLKNIHGQLIKCVQDKEDYFYYRFAETDDRNRINNFLDLLKKQQFLLYKFSSRVEFSAKVNRDNKYVFENCSKFLQGRWLEYHLYKEVCKFYERRQSEIICLSNLKFSTISESGEFDLIGLVDKRIIVFECKTGDYDSFRERIPRYVDRSQQLELPSKRFILVAPRLNLEHRQELSERHGITFAGLDDLEQVLEGAIA